MNSTIDGDAIHSVLRMQEVPDHHGKNLSHQYMARLASFVKVTWWWRQDKEQLLSMSLRKKILPAGISLHTNDNLPMTDSNSHFVHFPFLLSDLHNRDCSEWIISCFCSSEMLTVIVVVLIVIPRNVRCVVGPSIFKGFTGALRLLHTANMLERLSAHSWEAGVPAVKKSSR